MIRGPTILATADMKTIEGVHGMMTVGTTTETEATGITIAGTETTIVATIKTMIEVTGTTTEDTMIEGIKSQKSRVFFFSLYFFDSMPRYKQRHIFR